mmetsp:Transcript_113627/g.321752  ORF Transcript_113627/g.321752 Transcript_113627/m.321752 type:complete len:441 (-) Transcript_113627:209-1531(-)
MYSLLGEGSFRQRARNSESITRVARDRRQEKVARRTYDAINDFEEVLKAAAEAAAAPVDDLPMDAEAAHASGSLRRSIARDTASESSSGGGQPRPSALPRALSEPYIQPREHDQMDRDHGKRAHRPPSPLAMYDYGGISVRARSVFAQHCKQAGQTVRPSHRETSRGFYFPGAHFKQGPYGFSMLDPIHMPRQGWKNPRDVPTRWAGDPHDIRPPSMDVTDHRRNVAGRPALSEGVRSSTAHSLRTKLIAHSLDRRRQEDVLERVRFERGVVEAKWRDPLLDTGGGVPEGPGEQHDWVRDLGGDLSDAKQTAARILFGLDAVLRGSRSTLQHLFRAENRGTPGALEVEEFLRGLVKQGVFDEGEIMVSDIMNAMLVIDPLFNGRISYPVLSRAIAAATDARRQQSRALDRPEPRQQADEATRSFHSDSDVSAPLALPQRR